jgi:hypothetical protein
MFDLNLDRDERVRTHCERDTGKWAGSKVKCNAALVNG